MIRGAGGPLRTLRNMSQSYWYFNPTTGHYDCSSLQDHRRDSSHPYGRSNSDDYYGRRDYSSGDRGEYRRDDVRDNRREELQRYDGYERRNNDHDRRDPRSDQRAETRSSNDERGSHRYYQPNYEERRHDNRLHAHDGRRTDYYDGRNQGSREQERRHDHHNQTEPPKEERSPQKAHVQPDGKPRPQNNNNDMRRELHVINTPLTEYYEKNYKSAGVLPYARDPSGKLWFLFGEEDRTHKTKYEYTGVVHCHFGGKKEQNELPHQTAYREFSEESQGVLSNFHQSIKRSIETETSLIKVWSGASKYLLYFVPVPYDPNLPTAFDKIIKTLQSKPRNLEIEQEFLLSVRWVPVKDVIDSVLQRTPLLSNGLQIKLWEVMVMMLRPSALLSEIEKCKVSAVSKHV